jgi:hypothetical protein
MPAPTSCATASRMASSAWVSKMDFAWQEQTFDRGFGIKTRGNGFFKSRVILGIFQRLQ